MVSKISAIFSDVGGVLLTNGWDREGRRRLTEKFHLDAEDFEGRHELVTTAFETGQLSLDHYLERTAFYRPRSFTKQEVKDFMFAQSQGFPEALGLIERLARSGKYFLATLNNESNDLNLYRIGRFGLRKYFSVFFSSCFLGVMKPDKAIYDLALSLTQRPPQECLFIDDRPLNLECARLHGMRTVLYESPTQLDRDLRELGVEF